MGVLYFILNEEMTDSGVSHLFFLYEKNDILSNIEVFKKYFLEQFQIYRKLVIVQSSPRPLYLVFPIIDTSH